MEHTKECQETGCKKPAVTKGLCRNHYATWYYKQKKLKPDGWKNETPMQISRATCRIVGCNQLEMNNYLCKEHHDLLLGSI
jgi:hypothetical protein